MKFDNFFFIKIILNTIIEIKGTNISIINLTKLNNNIFDYIVTCSANSSIQVSSIVRSIKNKILKIIGEKPLHVEGLNNNRWILMDYNTIIINIFQKSIRSFYDIETLWLKRLFIK